MSVAVAFFLTKCSDLNLIPSYQVTQEKAFDSESVH